MTKTKYAEVLETLCNDHRERMIRVFDRGFEDPKNAEAIASNLEKSASEIRDLAKVYNLEKGN